MVRFGGGGEGGLGSDVSKKAKKQYPSRKRFVIAIGLHA
jgi:hypothetical protein